MPLLATGDEKPGPGPAGSPGPQEFSERAAVVLPLLVALSTASVTVGRNELQNNSGAATDWWAGAVEEDAIRSLPLDGEGGLWSSSFVPPPPRPEFLDDHATPDGLTTCDLCTWAWHDRGGLFPGDASKDKEGELSWVLTLAIVSILSAAIGAVVMVTVLQCRSRLKNVGSTGLCSLCITRSGNAATNAAHPPPSPLPSPASAAHFELSSRRPREGDKDLATSTFDSRSSNSGGGGRVWTWLTNRRSTTGPAQLSSPAPTSPAENHYTLDEAYTAVGEALYAELDRESTNSPAYQNTAYNGSDTEQDLPISSAPSSAYYSDLSCATAPDRTYEAVGIGMVTGTSSGCNWEGGSDIPLRRPPPARLAAITETISVPSDYV
ncbi:uncharacterized protein [Anabrus simplex]|uniref:uncharacterized protein n=1 Tax=Anabrus simplex TaxID=316456 RepID=UPI0035A3B8E6